MSQHDAYEFTSRENETIGRAATWSLALAGASLAMTIVHLVFAVVGVDLTGSSLRLLVFDIGPGLVSAGCYAAVALLFGVVGGSLRSVISTQGNDLKHMLKVLDMLHRIFVLRIALVFLTIIAVVAVIATGF
jgi:hypothetical protein